jgi:hypothetical protein
MQKLRDTYRSIKGHIGAETEPLESVEGRWNPSILEDFLQLQ